jgi:hypothetical protein
LCLNVTLGAEREIRNISTSKYHLTEIPIMHHWIICPATCLVTECIYWVGAFVNSCKLFYFFPPLLGYPPPIKMWTPLKRTALCATFPPPMQMETTRSNLQTAVTHLLKKKNVSYYAVLSKYWVCDILKHQFFQFHRSWVWHTILK